MDKKCDPYPMRIARRVDASDHFEDFLIWAVVAFLGIRLFLHLTGFPQVGGGGLHIAHMLWGGLLMLVAIILLLTFLGEWARVAASIVGGAGFGTFIDELGKFITADNDYFFKPTIALIYALFIVVFLVFRAFVARRDFTPPEMVVNAAATTVDVLLCGAQPKEIAQALKLLRDSGVDNAVTRAIAQVVAAAPEGDERPPLLVERMAGWVRCQFARFLAWQWFQVVVITVFVVYAAFFLVSASIDAVSLGIDRLFMESTASVATTGYVLSSAATALVAVVGACRLPRSRLDALTWFRRSVLLSIFFVQFFRFYNDELGAVGGLVVDLLFLAALNTMLNLQRHQQPEPTETTQATSAACR